MFNKNKGVAFSGLVRTGAVHEGVIGNSGKEKAENYWKLDHILRDSILNMIGYESWRKRKTPYFSKSDMLHKEPTGEAN